MINPWQALYMRPLRVTFVIFFLVLISLSMLFRADGTLANGWQIIAILGAITAAFYSWRYLHRKRAASRVADKANLHGR